MGVPNVSTWTDEARDAFESYFVPANLIAESQREDSSPLGQFRLTIARYHSKPGAWNVSRGVVTRVGDGAVIADIKRNYGAFWHAWVSHPDGNEYLLCGENYQGYTLINLTQETIVSYLPPEARKGFGFCWAAVYPSPGGRTLAVDGCVWAAPYELRLYDFTDPMVLPFPELARFEGLERVIGWESDRTVAFEIAYSARKSDGARYMDLTDEEQLELDRNPTQWLEVKEEMRWTRP
jgi:hypothetical protein